MHVSDLVLGVMLGGAIALIAALTVIRTLHRSQLKPRFPDKSNRRMQDQG